MPKSFYVEAGSAKLHISQSGHAGPAIILLHFWGGSQKTFRYIAQELSENSRVFSIDFRGWGASVGPADADTPLSAYSITQLAQDVEVVIDSLGETEILLLGHSMGAKVAQLVVARQQQLESSSIKGLVLLAPAPPTPLDLPDEARKQQLAAYESRAAAEFVMRNVLTSSRVSDAGITLLVDDALRGNQVARQAWPLHAMAEDISSETRGIKGPVLVIAGELDKVETLERVKNELLPNVGVEKPELVVVPGVGHMLPIEAPEKVVEEVQRLAQNFHF